MESSRSKVVPNEDQVHQPPVQQLHRFLMMDENVMMKQIHAIHDPDGRQIRVKPLLNMIEDVLQRTIPSPIDGIVQANSEAHVDALGDGSQHVNFIGLLEALANTIQNLSCELSWKCCGGCDAHTTTIALFNKLSCYSWETKPVLALAAFAVNYGRFTLVAQLYQDNYVAKFIALLKQVPNSLERNESLKHGFEALNTLIKAMLDVTKCIVEFQELPNKYIDMDTPVMSLVLHNISTAVYWTIRSAVVGSSQIFSLMGLSHDYAASDLSSLASNVNDIHANLRKQLSICNEYIDHQRELEACEILKGLFKISHIDNMEILRALIYAHDDILPLYDGASKNMVNLEVLKSKHVLLLISGLDISHQEVSILDQIYRESQHQSNRVESLYEVVWLPVADKPTTWTNEKQKTFETLKIMMPWYSVHHPSILRPAALKHIKEVMGFTSKTILVVLDQQGRVTNQNALHMMWIWGNEAFPFTNMREAALLKEETWRLKLLVNGIDQNILNWVREGKLICLYGGDDLNWICKFTLAAQVVSQAIQIPMELMYVGKRNPKESIKRNNEVISADKLSHTWPDRSSIWFFWFRLESMWYSKMQHGKTVDTDPIMQEVRSMLNFDDSDQGWAVISDGSGEMAKADGENMLISFKEIDQWKEHVKTKGFVTALRDYLYQLTAYRLNQFQFPKANKSISEIMVCGESILIEQKNI